MRWLPSAPIAVLLLLLTAGAALLPRPAAAVEKITVLGLFRDKAVLLVDGKRRVLEAGETSREGVTLVSADSKEAVIEIDGRRATYGLGTHIGSSFAAPERPAVQIWPTHDMYFVVGSINGYPVNFLVDTGATLVAMNSREASRLGIDYFVEGERATFSTASGNALVYIVDLERVRVGDIELRNVKAAVHEGGHPTEVLLGMSFLGRLDMSRSGRMLELRRR